MNLHSVLFSQGMVLQTKDSIDLIKNIIEFSKEHENFYFSADTGPSIMVLSEDVGLINDFRDRNDDNFITGTNDFTEHEKNINSFTKDAIEYFKN